MKTPDLKPCPCCGGTPNVDSYPGSDWVGDLTYHCVRCTVCFLRTRDYKSPQMAADAWNRRTNEENA